MTEAEADRLVQRIYWLALMFGAIGFVAYFVLQGWRPAVAFALGALVSVGNILLFEKLTRLIQPANEGDPPQKSWQAGLFIIRYFLLFTFGYAIVKALGVNGLAVIIGVLVSTAAVLTSTLIDLLQKLFAHRPSQ